MYNVKTTVKEIYLLKMYLHSTVKLSSYEYRITFGDWLQSKLASKTKKLEMFFSINFNKFLNIASLYRGIPQRWQSGGDLHYCHNAVHTTSVFIYILLSW